MRKDRGITLVALVITIIVILILAGITLNLVTGQNGIINKAMDASEQTKKAEANEEEEYDYVTKLANSYTGGNVYFDETKGCNEPQVAKTFTKIKWDNNSEVLINKSNISSWYNYTTENGQSKWANIKDNNGNYFVWIPRFAYKIIYYTDSTYTTTSSESTSYGRIDVKLLKNLTNIAADGTICKKYNDSTLTSSDYIVHPAFTSDINAGGWESELPGFWVAKYDASMEVYNTTNNQYESYLTSSKSDGNVQADGTNVRLAFKPGNHVWMYVNLANCYLNSYNYNRSQESHLIKNSEYGALAYLSNSQYGRNGETLTRNSTKYTGDSNIYEATQESTTGNVYGVYDIYGAGMERTAAYIKAQVKSQYLSGDYLGYDGTTFYSANGSSTKYCTVYQSTAVAQTLIGDAILEIRGFSNAGFKSFGSTPFMHRGGCYGDGTGGYFSYTDWAGNPDGYSSYRAVLIVNLY